MASSSICVLALVSYCGGRVLHFYAVFVSNLACAAPLVCRFCSVECVVCTAGTREVDRSLSAPDRSPSGSRKKTRSRSNEFTLMYVHICQYFGGDLAAAACKNLRRVPWHTVTYVHVKLINILWGTCCGRTEGIFCRIP